MQLLAAALIGLFIGSAVNWASDVLPRYAGHPDHPMPRFRVFALTAPISLSGAVEILNAVAFAALWALTPDPLRAVGICAAFALLLLIAVTDLKHRLIPNVVVYPLLIAVIVISIANGLFAHTELRPTLIGGVLTFGMFTATSMLKPGSLGGGDVKLAALIGLTFGFPSVLWALIVGVGSGALMAIWLLMRRRGVRTFPYAPFLCFGAMITLLYNPITWTVH